MGPLEAVAGVLVGAELINDALCHPELGKGDLNGVGVGQSAKATS
jgi:hypothetical protein